MRITSPAIQKEQDSIWKQSRLPAEARGSPSRQISGLLLHHPGEDERRKTDTEVTPLDHPTWGQPGPACRGRLAKQRNAPDRFNQGGLAARPLFLPRGRPPSGLMLEDHAIEDGADYLLRGRSGRRPRTEAGGRRRGRADDRRRVTDPRTHRRPPARRRMASRVGWEEPGP